MKKTRIAALFLALALCLGLLPVAAMAEEEAAGYRVIFYEDLSGGQDYANLTVNAEGRLDNFPAPPTRTGYTFAGWVETQDGPIITEDHVFTGDAELFAVWESQAPSGGYVLKLDPNGGTCSVERVKLDASGTAPTLKEELPVPTREGYTFAGWFVGGTEVKTGSAFGGTETAVAKWTKEGAQDPVRVDFIPNGGVIESIRGIPAGDILAGSELATKNHIFVDRNSGIGMMETDGSGHLDSLPVIKREDCAFEGWYVVGSGALNNAYAGKEVDIPSGAKRADLTTVFQADALLAAKWTKKAANPDGPFTVKFDLNCKNPKQDEIPKEQTIVKGSAVSMPDGGKLTPPATNLEFYAWCLLSDNGRLYPWTASTAVMEDMTLYAGWVKKGTVVKTGEALPDASKPAETTKPAETAKPAAPAFTDVPATSPFAPAIAWAVEQKITNGKTPTAFGPGDPCTRAQIVTFLWRAAGSPEPKTMEAEYADAVNTSAYYYKAIQWAAEMGMEESGTFKPGDPCTRGQAMYFIWRANDPGTSAGSVPSFTDLPKDSLYYDAVLWAVGQGVTKGTGDGTTFSPDSPCTRGQIVTFLYRAYVK